MKIGLIDVDGHTDLKNRMAEQITCSKCKRELPISDFYDCNHKVCKECICERAKMYRTTGDIEKKRQNANRSHRERRKRNKFTKDGWIEKIYSSMTYRQKKKWGIKLPFSRQDLSQWIDTNYSHKFDEMMENYKDSNGNKYLCPSIDRINDYKPYSFDNMQLVTWDENNKKGRAGTKNKESAKNIGKEYFSKEVTQYDTNGNYIKTYASTHEVERQTGYDASLIARACRRNAKGIRCVTKGYLWKYTKESKAEKQRRVIAV